jgi:hypothetical protein
MATPGLNCFAAKQTAIELIALRQSNLLNCFAAKQFIGIAAAKQTIELLCGKAIQ